MSNPDLKTTLQTAGAIASLKKEEPTCPGIEFNQRLIFFVVQGVIGLLLVISNILPFGNGNKVYTLSAGIVILVTSTLWLINYKTLFSKMLEPVRFVNAIILFGCMIACIVLNIIKKDKDTLISTLIFAISIVESCAAVWYMLSFIPFAQNLAAGCCKGCCNACQKGMEA